MASAIKDHVNTYVYGVGTIKIPSNTLYPYPTVKRNCVKLVKMMVGEWSVPVF